jgi:hypothetical protein
MAALHFPEDVVGAPSLPGRFTLAPGLSGSFLTRFPAARPEGTKTIQSGRVGTRQDDERMISSGDKGRLEKAPAAQYIVKSQLVRWNIELSTLQGFCAEYEQSVNRLQQRLSIRAQMMCYIATLSGV